MVVWKGKGDMKVMISGTGGLIGSALKSTLEREGCDVVALPRSYEQKLDFRGVDTVIHLAGESIAKGRWNTEKKRRIRASRISGTKQLAEQMADSEFKPLNFICASAIGYYGDRGDEILDESSDAGQGFLPEVCEEWEQATAAASDAGIRTLNIRTGIVLSAQGGALKTMLPPFMAGLGGILGHGSQYMSWISLDDEISIIRYLMNHEGMHGEVNLVSPNPVTNREFTKILSTVIKRPAFLPMPAVAARILFGEMADALLLSSTRVYPRKLLDSGYEFIHPTLESALRKVLNEQ